MIYTSPFLSYEIHNYATPGKKCLLLSYILAKGENRTLILFEYFDLHKDEYKNTLSILTNMCAVQEHIEYFN